MTKAGICAQLIAYFKTELFQLQTDIQATQTDIANETKSSAGDKYETAREMAQQEISKLQNQIQITQHIIGLLSQASVETNSQFGTMLETSQGIFILGISFKRINLAENISVMGIGLNAPLAIQLLNFKTKKEITLPNGQLKILSEIL